MSHTRRLACLAAAVLAATVALPGRVPAHDPVPEPARFVPQGCPSEATGYHDAGFISMGDCQRVCRRINERMRLGAHDVPAYCIGFVHRAGRCMFCLRTPDTATFRGYEYNRNRPGLDYDRFGSPSVAMCARRCLADARCRSFTYVVRGRLAQSRDIGQCWLKSGVPAGLQDGCCISGVVRP